MSSFCTRFRNRGLVTKAPILVAMYLGFAAAPGTTGPLHIQRVVDDMTLPHEGRPQDVWNTSDWGEGPRMGKGNNIPSDWPEPCFIPWGAVFLEDGTSPSSDVRAQIRNVKGYIYSKSRGQWEMTHSGDFGGGWYKTDYTSGSGGTRQNEPDANGGGVSVTLASHNIFHFWGNARVPFDRNDLGGVFTSVEFRLTGSGDMSKARYLVHMGGDYYESPTWSFDPDNPDWSGVGDAAIGRFRFATGDWQTVTMHTMTTEQIRANPPPPVSDEPEPDTEAPQLVAVVAPTETSVEVRFTEEVTTESAEEVGNYSISDGIDVVGAALNAGNTSVLLTTSALTLGKTYTLTVSNITDRASTPNTGGDQKEFSYTGKLQITGLTVASGKSYEIAQSIADGDKQYIDREFTFASLGDLAGTTCIRTANADKSLSGDQFLSFSANRRVTVYVAYDNRVSAPPAWLSSWDNDGERAGISEAYPDGITVYSRRFDAGTVSLGANGATEYESMYGVFVDAVGDETFVSHAVPHKTLHTGTVRVLPSGRTVRVAGLQPNRVYTLTMTDARGRVSRVRKAVGNGGTVPLSTNLRSRGVYILSVRSTDHHARTRALLQ